MTASRAADAARDKAGTLGNSDPETAALLLLQADALQGEATAKFEAAIRMTESAYGVGPQHRIGAIAGGPLKGAQTAWEPGYLPPPQGKLAETARKIATTDPASGVPVELYETVPYGLRSQDNSRANTFIDGKVVVTLNTFRQVVAQGNPGYIASALNHEAVHFDELVTTGWGSASSRESKAYAADARDGAVFGLTRSERLQAFTRSLKLQTLGRLFFQPAYPDSTESAQSKGLYEGEQALLEAARRDRLDIERRAALARQHRESSRDKAPDLPFGVPAPAEAPRAPYGAPAPARVASEEVFYLAADACRGDFVAASTVLYEHSQLSGGDIAALETRAASMPWGCLRALLYRLTAMRRAGETLTLERLQTETSAAQAPTPDYGDVGREPRQTRPCTRHGIWYQDCY